MNNYVMPTTGHVIDLDNPDSIRNIPKPDIFDELWAIKRFGGRAEMCSVYVHTTMCIANAKTDRLKELMMIHDVHEAFLGDIPTPIKKLLVDYRVIEKFDDVIYDYFNIVKPNDYEKTDVKSIDYASYMYEIATQKGYSELRKYLRADGVDIDNEEIVSTIYAKIYNFKQNLNNSYATDFINSYIY